MHIYIYVYIYVHKNQYIYNILQIFTIIYLSIISIYPSIHPSIYPSIYQFIYPYIYIERERGRELDYKYDPAPCTLLRSPHLAVDLRGTVPAPLPSQLHGAEVEPRSTEQGPLASRNVWELMEL